MSESIGVRRVVICVKHGGFSLSLEALSALRELGSECALRETAAGEKYPYTDEVRKSFMDSYCRDIPRDDPLLLKVVDSMGQAAAGQCCKIGIVEIPRDVSWHVEEYDGFEHVAQDHRTWQGTSV